VAGDLPSDTAIEDVCVDPIPELSGEFEEGRVGLVYRTAGSCESLRLRISTRRVWDLHCYLLGLSLTQYYHITGDDMYDDSGSEGVLVGIVA